jgi:hypothetical protein
MITRSITVHSKLPDISHNTKCLKLARLLALIVLNQANMPLYTAEAPIIAELAGDIQALPALNLPSPSDRADDIQVMQTQVSSLDIDAKQKRRAGKRWKVSIGPPYRTV